MLVYRWGCLRKPIPVNVTIPKISAPVKCLWILHNYCIDERLLRQSILEQSETDCAAVLAIDRGSILLNDCFIGTRLDENDNNIDIDDDNVGCNIEVGHHFDDCLTTRIRRQLAQNQIIQGNQLPRDEMIQHL